jgi:hypothetical protein
MRSEAQKKTDAAVEDILKNQKVKKSSKMAAANDDTEEEHEAAVALFSDAQLKKAEADIIKALNAQAIKKEEHDQAKGATRAAYNNAEKMGVPVAALKFIIEKMGKLDEDFKANVNILQERRGEATLFNIPEVVPPLVERH